MPLARGWGLREGLAHQRHSRQTPEALPMGCECHSQPSAIWAFNHQLLSTCSGLGPGLGAGDPGDHSVTALEGLAVQGRSRQVERQLQG